MICIGSTLFSQVGIGTANPRGALDINKETTNNMGLVLPTNADVNNIINPMGGSVVPGTIMYDSTNDCVKYYKASGAWSECLCAVAAQVCTEDVAGQPFSSINGTTITFNQPATDYGFVLDIYTLDENFLMSINGTNISSNEIFFDGGGINARFTDGSRYGVEVPNIFTVIGNASNPLIRLIISPTGNITMFGSKVSGGQLYPMELYNGNSFNTVVWNTASPNTLRVTQTVQGPTNITGYGSGKRIIPCS